MFPWDTFTNVRIDEEDALPLNVIPAQSPGEGVPLFEISASRCIFGVDIF